MEWFRFWNQTINCPKVQRLPGETYKVWSNLLCLASIEDEDGLLPDLEDIAFALRLSVVKVDGYVGQLIKAGLIDEDQETKRLRMHDWRHWQPPRDDVKGRMRRYRERKASATNNGPVTSPLRNALRNATRNSSVPEAEAEAETDTDKEAEAPPTPSRRGGGAAAC